MPVANPAMPAERLQLSANVAQWYYIEGLSQEQIGTRAGLSRIAVARLLDEARKLKIVEIAIKPPIPTVPELESRLMHSFGLRAVRVLERRTAGDAEALRALGSLGALVLGDLLRDNSVFGIAWGSASQAVVRALTPRTLTGVRVVQLVGSVGVTYRQIDAAEQVRSAARVLQAQHVYINSPLVVSSREGCRRPPRRSLDRRGVGTGQSFRCGIAGHRRHGSRKLHHLSGGLLITRRTARTAGSRGCRRLLPVLL